MDKGKTTKEVNAFCKSIKKEFKVDSIILFGSHARGDNWKQSDYDFIIVSDDFKDMHWLKRISKIVEYWDMPVGIDILPYTREEFEHKKKNSSVVRSAVKEGIVVA